MVLAQTQIARRLPRMDKRIRARLRRWVDAAGVDAVAEATGAHRDTVIRWTGGGTTPRGAALKALLDALERRERESAA